MLAEPCTPDNCDNSKNTVLACQGRPEAERPGPFFKWVKGRRC